MPSTRANARPRATPMTWSGAAPRSARAKPTAPRPASAMTTTAPGAPARERHRGEVGAGRHEQRDPVPYPDTGRGEARGELAHAALQEVEGDRPSAPLQLDDGGRLVTGPGVERRPDGRQAGPALRRSGPDLARQPPPRVDGAAWRVLGHEVRGLLVAVDLRVRQPLAQVPQVAVGEHRVARTPQQQHRHVGQRRQISRDAVQRRRADVLGLERDVGDELPHGPSSRGVAVGRGERGADVFGQRWAGQGAGDTDERRRGRADRPPQRRGAGEPDERRRGRIGGLVHRGVGQHDGLRAGRGGPGAQPSDIGPPQSCATDTTGPSTPSASVTVVRSATRCASVRGPSRRSENPMPSWSTAITRQPAGASRGTGATGRTTSGCRGRIASSLRWPRPDCRARARCG